MEWNETPAFVFKYIEKYMYNVKNVAKNELFTPTQIAR